MMPLPSVCLAFLPGRGDLTMTQSGTANTNDCGSAVEASTRSPLLLPGRATALAGAVDAAREGLIKAILVGRAATIADIAKAKGLEAGNMVAKQLSFLANADSAGLVPGARCR